MYFKKKKKKKIKKVNYKTNYQELTNELAIKKKVNKINILISLPIEHMNSFFSNLLKNNRERESKVALFYIQKNNKLDIHLTV